MVLHTRRLRLIPATPEIARAELQGRSALAASLGAEVPETWPPDLFDAAAVEYVLARLEADASQAEWWLYYFVREADGTSPAVLVGAGGYKGPPDAEGTVEIGYAIASSFRRQGFATEAARGLIAHAFRRPEVTRVIAETLPDLTASIGVLEKCGFWFVGEGSEPGVIRYALTR